MESSDNTEAALKTEKSATPYSFFLCSIISSHQKQRLVVKANVAIHLAVLPCIHSIRSEGWSSCLRLPLALLELWLFDDKIENGIHT